MTAVGACCEVYAATKLVATVELQCADIGGLNERRPTMIDSDVREYELPATAELALNDMFGQSSHFCGITQGKCGLSVESKAHQPVVPHVQAELGNIYSLSPVLRAIFEKFGHTSPSPWFLINRVSL